MSTSPRLAVLTALLLAALPATHAGASPDARADRVSDSATATVQAYPSPGTRTAVPGTGVTFRGLDHAAAAPVRVSGSASGGHTLVWHGHRDGRGVTLQPRVPFTPGELVSVRGVAVAGGQGDRFSFNVARPGRHPGLVALRDDVGTVASRESTRSVSGPPYKTRPDLRPPRITVTTPARGTAPGLLLTEPGTADGSGVALMDNRGQMVWYHGTVHPFVFDDLEKASYRGRDVLTWFEGSAPYGPGSYRGVWQMADSTYRRIATIRAQNGMSADTHDLEITSNGRAYLLIYNPVIQDLSAIGGRRDTTVLELVIQEVDIASGDLLFEWHSLDPGHFPVTDAVGLQVTDNPVDYIHGNSVRLDTDGNLLVSARNISTVFKVNRHSGAVMWRLGGKRNQFAYSAGETGPRFQHDAVRLRPGVISIFDNGVGRGASRGVQYRLDEVAHTATRIKEVRRSPNIFAFAQGNYQTLPNGGSLIDWGYTGVVTEFDAMGVKNFEFRAPYNLYRTFRETWTGRPASLPAVVGQRRTGHDTVFVSWNGATEVASWEVLGGGSRSSLASLTTVPREGFETAINVPHSSFVRVRGKTAAGTVLGTSAVVPVGPWFSEHATLPAAGRYRPFAGDFVGGSADDVVFYAPGPGADALWSAGAGGVFTTGRLPPVNGDYKPLVGDFVGDAHDDILWWTPGRTVAHLWRSDGVGGFADVAVHVPVVAEAKVLAHRSGPDEVLWYNPGSGRDEIAGYSWDVGSAASRHQRSIVVNGTYRPVIGDFDGNGWVDIVWYAAGSAADWYWRLTGSRGGASFGQLQSRVPIDGSYSPLAGRFSPDHDSRDDIVWYARGRAADYVWEGTSGAGFIRSGHTNGATGDPVLLGGAQDHLFLRGSGTSDMIWVPNGHPDIVRSTGNAALGDEYQPIAGDFAGTGVSGLLWYAAGPAPEHLYLGKLG